MKIQNEQIRQVLALLGSPEMVNQSHEMAIRTFISSYPFVQPAYYLLAKSTLYQDCNIDDKSLAATYASNGETMYRSIYQSDKFLNGDFETLFEKVKNEWKSSISPWAGFKSKVSLISETEDIVAIDHQEVVVPQVETVEIIDLSNEPGLQTIEQEQVAEANVEYSMESQEIVEKEEIRPVVLPFEIETFDHVDQSFHHHFAFPFVETKKMENQGEIPQVKPLEVQRVEDKSIENQEFKIPSIADLLNPEEETEPRIEKKGNATISKYDDEAMPYSFQWWLQKTRSDYYESHQPFTNHRNHHSENTQGLTQRQAQDSVFVDKTEVNPLENQYKEHIFNLQTPFNTEEFLEVNEKVDKNKTSRIIDRFIETDPQISAPMPNKLDNENKARLSTDENSEFVTETLAKIYVEQMLYDKAIVVYQKLSLKIPEKSRYFAHLISQLQERINKA